jgi:tetratricopeptide (TPR) repeat protein
VITCRKCNQQIQGRALFCPHCGSKLEQPQAVSSGRRQESFAISEESESESRGCGLSLAVLMVAVVVMVAILGLAFAAYYYGMQDRAQATRVAAQEHYVKGTDYIGQGEYELAIAELERTLQLDPNHPHALRSLDEARQRIEVRPTPTRELEVETKAAMMQELRDAYRAEDWQRVYDHADRLLALDPTYMRSEVDMILFEAFYRTGMQFVEQGQLKEAVRLFDRALALQPDNVQVVRAKHLATLYMTAMGYWNADWSRAAETLQELYRMAPDYVDTRQQLRQALVSYGDQLVQQGDGCAAHEQYSQALQFGGDASVEAKYRQAREICSEQPPSDDITTDATGTPWPQGPSGVYIGRVTEQTNIDHSAILIRGRVLDSSGRPVAGTHVKIQAWDWSATAITDGNGQFSFDGLTNPVNYTLSLVQLPSQPVEAPGERGKLTWVHFEQAR